MMNIKGIFAVSLIAMVAMVAGVHTSNAVAAIASQGYVDQQVGSKLSSISGSTTGTGNVVTDVSASGSAVSATKGITAEETKNKVKSVRAVASATDTAYPSEKAVATALAGKQATLSGAQLNAVNSGITSTKVSTYDGYNEKITAAQSAAAAAQSTASGKLSSISGSTTGTGNVVTSVSASGSNVSATKGITAEETKNKVTSVRAAASATDTAYPSEKAVATALAGKQATLSGAQLNAVNSGITSTKVSTYDGYNEKITAAQSAAAAAQSTASGKLSSISGSTTGTGNVVTDVSASGSNVSATKGITAEETKNKVTSTNYDANVSSDTKYPTVKAVAGAIADVEKKIPAAITVDSALSSTSTNPVQNKVVNTALNSKEVTSNKVTSTNYAANVSNDTKYPTVKAVADAIADVEEKIPAAITVDAALNSTSTNPVQNKVINTALNSKEVTSNKVTSTNYAANVSNDTKYPTVKAVADAIADAATTASDILTTTTVTSSGTGAVLTGVSVTPGKVTLQKGNVQIPSGGQNATSYVSIWVE